MDSTLSVLGSLASIGAAIWAFFEASKAAKAATRAEAVRDEIIDRRRLVEVSQVYADTKRILAVAAEIGPATNPKLLRGVDTAKIAKQIEEYSRSLLEQSSHYSDVFGNDARRLCEELRPQIESLAGAVTPEQKMDSGRNIYYSISAFIGTAKSVADDKREHQPKQDLK